MNDTQHGTTEVVHATTLSVADQIALAGGRHVAARRTRNVGPLIKAINNGDYIRWELSGTGAVDAGFAGYQAFDGLRRLEASIQLGAPRQFHLWYSVPAAAIESCNQASQEGLASLLERLLSVKKPNSAAAVTRLHWSYDSGILGQQITGGIKPDVERPTNLELKRWYSDHVTATGYEFSQAADAGTELRKRIRGNGVKPAALGVVDYVLRGVDNDGAEQFFQDLIRVQDGARSEFADGDAILSLGAFLNRVSVQSRPGNTSVRPSVQVLSFLKAWQLRRASAQVELYRVYQERRSSLRLPSVEWVRDDQYPSVDTLA